VATIWRTGRISQIAIAFTFVAALFLPIPVAVAVGVALSLLLQLNREALDLAVVELVARPDVRFEERPAPAVLPSRAVTVLDVYGSLYYAGSRTLQVRLPDPVGSSAPAVVLRMRHRTALGATFVVVLADYAKRLQAVDGRLFLSGVDPVLLERMRRTGRVHVERPVKVFEATDVNRRVEHGRLPRGRGLGRAPSGATDRVTTTGGRRGPDRRSWPRARRTTRP
jgi:sulfate permease, SulP family